MADNQIIEEYRKSVAEKNRAKAAIAGLFLSTVILFTFLTWASAKGFLSTAVPEISNLLATRLTNKSDNYLKVVNSSATRILPVYSGEFQSVLKKEWPRIEQAGEAELKSLNKYSQAKWPEIERNLSLVANNQRQVIREELEKVLGKEQKSAIAESYSLAALNSYNSFIDRNFSQHSIQGHSVGVNLRKIVEREPDVSTDIDLHQAVGLALEVLGLELQELGKK